LSSSIPFPTRRSSDLLFVIPALNLGLNPVGFEIVGGSLAADLSDTSFASFDSPSTLLAWFEGWSGSFRRCSAAVLSVRPALNLGDRKSTRLNSSHVKI